MDLMVMRLAASGNLACRKDSEKAAATRTLGNSLFSIARENVMTAKARTAKAIKIGFPAAALGSRSSERRRSLVDHAMSQATAARNRFANAETGHKANRQNNCRFKHG